VPWRGPNEPGEFPSLGWLIGEWIEEHCIVPDGEKLGEPYLLTDEMWEHLVWSYRVLPTARDGDGSDAMAYRGDQLVRPQKWGKDPLNAARCCVHALGPVVFAGWDAQGEPVGRPHPSPWIAIAAYNETQTDNTYRPLMTMLQGPKLVNTPGLDIGLEGVKLPGGVGWIDPVTSSASGKLGGRFTYVSITESGLLVGEGRTGGVTFGRVLKRNVGGMGGMWSEITNPWDPTEKSVAQRTYEAKAKDVYINYRLPRQRVELDDDEGLTREIIYLYGDSVRERGGWVSAKRIKAEVQDKSMGEAEVRRFFLQEIVSGTRDLVTAAGWASLARPDTDPLRPKEAVCLGFDGSRTSDATALKICRIRDAKLFKVGIWTPADYPDHKVPRPLVHQAVVDVFKAYDVHFMFADPHKWSEYIDIWSGLFPKRVVEFATNVEQRMDAAVVRFMTAFANAELLHDGDDESTQHVLNTMLVKGKQKKGRFDDNGIPEHYLGLAKKRSGVLIDGCVADVLALEARGYAVEHGALADDSYPPAAAPVTQADDVHDDELAFWRPNRRLSDLI